MNAADARELASLDIPIWLWLGLVGAIVVAVVAALRADARDHRTGSPRPARHRR